MIDAPKESLCRKKHHFFWAGPKFEGTPLPKLILTLFRAKTKVKKLPILIAGFPAVFFHISHWYLYCHGTTDKSKSHESAE